MSDAPSMDLAGMSGPRQAEQYGVGALCGSVSGAYRTFQTVSTGSPTLERAPWTNFGLCEVALFGPHPRSAGHGSRTRAFCQLRGFVTANANEIISQDNK